MDINKFSPHLVGYINFLNIFFINEFENYLSLSNGNRELFIEMLSGLTEIKIPI